MPGKAICVLGMHRSGTSATTGMLQLLGVELGEHLMAGHADVNALGYFEHVRIQELNDRLLEIFNASWDSVLPVDCAAEASGVDAIRGELASVLGKDFGGTEVWGVKDPRICRLLPVWKTLFSGAGVKPHYLHVVRHPIEVAASLARRDEFSTEKSCCLWLDHVFSAEKDTRGETRTFVTYEELVADPVATATAIGKELEIAWPMSVDEIAGSLRDFISVNLRHHHDTSEDPETGSWARLAVDVYEAIAASGPGGPLPNFWDRLDRDFSERRNAFDPALVEHLRQETASRIRLLNRNLGIRNSLSWKILAPVRVLQRLFGIEPG